MPKTKPIKPVAQVLITFTPAVPGNLPDADKNVLLLLRDGTTCEGFLDTIEPDGRQVWRDVTADEIDDVQDRVNVLAWAEMPEGLTDPARTADPRQAALKDACALLEGWVLTKCPKKYQAEHMAHIAELRAVGQA